MALSGCEISNVKLTEEITALKMVLATGVVSSDWNAIPLFVEFSLPNSIEVPHLLLAEAANETRDLPASALTFIEKLLPVDEPMAHFVHASQVFVALLK